MLMNADVVYDYSGRDFVKSLVRREAEYVSLDPSILGQRQNSQTRNVVICIAGAGPEVWQGVIDLPRLEGYRQFP